MYFFGGILLMILSLGIYSCEKDQSNEIFETPALKRAAPQVLGNYDGQNFTFAIDETIILRNWNANLLNYEGINARLTKITFTTIDGAYYLRATGEEYTSTLILDIDGSGNATEGITCTSKSCSNSSTGCIPKKDKLSCTNCGIGGVADCVKTVTALTLAPNTP